MLNYWKMIDSVKKVELVEFGAWRSLVAHLHGAQVVGGSNPLAPTKFNFIQYEGDI